MAATTALARQLYGGGGFDRQHRLLQLDCSADLRHYSRNLGPGVQERIFQTTSDALRSQLDEHRDFLLRHQGQQQQQQPQLAPAPVVSGPPTTSIPLPYNSHPNPPPRLQSAAPRPIPPRKPIPGDVSTYPQALSEAVYSQKATAAMGQPHGARTVYHIVCRTEKRYSKEETVVVGSCRSLLAANEVAARYFLENCLGDGDEAKYKQLITGAVSCEVPIENGRRTVYTQEGRLE
ncbi:hypothetical protein CFE70_005674 [Pyrenophora teres f. teres 0-1]|uniref:Uncharacterized protein n=1 Tax=Pyrenophora teres f. teres TaxID=97479 RepID=A0A6S6W3J5_9PLEO|nr:hypothetical protein HRS9139_03198 [Pyrenophora teres f. teres]CAA9962265.1 hypothetical protein PTMSG1_05641 [Pyrenophora teres f. maculata]KAE8844780.1 hypothetical protein PTNB85_03045 [Pyrenophora teres f. teres]KAE8847018.1 hypothetical protein HRS9122_03925 [Pyrenophora teres f. teres]KAE8866072.1 hypothetical protein PTNB29_03219 [Pyrenophora teres f. teres]